LAPCPHWEALASEVRDLEGEAFMEPEAQARDRGDGDVVVSRGSGCQEAPAFLHPAHSGEMVGGLRAHAREGVPVALEDLLREEAHATLAEAHGRGGKAVDGLAVPEVALTFLCRNAVGGCVGELGEETDCTDRRFLRPFAFATALERRNHVLTQWGHARAPF
jgi:hypothetical protein